MILKVFGTANLAYFNISKNKRVLNPNSKKGMLACTGRLQCTKYNCTAWVAKAVECGITCQKHGNGQIHFSIFDSGCHKL